MLEGKKILIGVTGSIAAYKAAMLIRLLVKAGAEVRVIMTGSAAAFISPLTLATLSKNPVLSSFEKDDNTGTWNNHVELGLWADMLLVAPASAHTLARFAHGICNDLLTATYLSARCPVWLAPAMDLDMLAHPSTQQNLMKLKEYGNIVIEPESGELASGLTGKGRLTEPEEIKELLLRYFSGSTFWKNKKILVTAGPTQEPLDPVRFIGNHSSGKMGYAIARLLAKKGAKVTLISGPTQLPDPVQVDCIRIQTAEEMYQKCIEHFPGCDGAILSAAVADYRPRERATKKIKKEDQGDDLKIELVRNPDIAAALGKQKQVGQWIVGFALETHDEEVNARKKLENKNMDLIVLNSLQEAGSGFGYDTNNISIFHKNRTVFHSGLKSKDQIAEDIIQEIENAKYR